ncbi:MAG: hypothetical protein JWP15_1828 [Alphaproteobacteria bacterium]|nr:hypothetical protein [Alphaproteobacteria bacterium]
MPLTPGDWRYQQDSGGSEAVFAAAGAGIFSVRCERSGRSIVLTRFAGGGSRLRLTTTYGTRALTGRAEGAGVAATVAASDSLLDAIAFSRGRFTVESESGAMLVLPSWPEPARVVEDCRGQG